MDIQALVNAQALINRAVFESNMPYPNLPTCDRDPDPQYIYEQVTAAIKELRKVEVSIK